MNGSNNKKISNNKMIIICIYLNIFYLTYYLAYYLAYYLVLIYIIKHFLTRLYIRNDLLLKINKIIVNDKNFRIKLNCIQLLLNI